MTEWQKQQSGHDDYMRIIICNFYWFVQTSLIQKKRKSPENLELSKIILIFAANKQQKKMLVLQDCIDKLSEFKQTFGRQYGITKLGIFGSVARQENTEDSDIDIVVEVEKPTLSLMYELREKLKALFNCDVDLVRFRSTLRPLFKSNILSEVVYV